MDHGAGRSSSGGRLIYLGARNGSALLTSDMKAIEFVVAAVALIVGIDDGSDCSYRYCRLLPRLSRPSPMFPPPVTSRLPRTIGWIILDDAPTPQGMARSSTLMKPAFIYIHLISQYYLPLHLFFIHNRVSLGREGTNAARPAVAARSTARSGSSRWAAPPP